MYFNSVKYLLNINPWGALAFVLLMCTHIPSSYSQEDAQQDTSLDSLFELSLTELSQIRIDVGTRGQNRPIFDSPVPISVITANDIKKTGLTDLGLVLQRLLPFVNYPRPTINDGTDHTPPLFMRGMNPDQILVLVNGKRRHITSLVHTNIVGRGSTSIDFNTIPVDAIERVEVLRDGASAQYGSDAIAGIINIVLKSDVENYLKTQYGQTIQNDGVVNQITTHFGTNIKEKGFFTLTSEFRKKGATNRSGIDVRQQYFDYQTAENAEFEANPFQTFRLGEAESDNFSLVLNAAVPVDTATRIYSFSTFNYRESEAGGFFRRPQDNRTVREVYPDGFLPLIKPVTLDGSFLLGLESKINGWDVDVSSGYGINSFKFNVGNSINTSMGTESPTEFYAGTLIFSQLTSNVDLFRDLNIRLKNPLKIGLGAEFRVENFQIRKGEEAAYTDGGVAILDGPNAGDLAPVGAQVFPGFTPDNETNQFRNNKAVYIDLENSLFNNLLVGLAGRYEDYSDFGSSWNGNSLSGTSQ
ncbi:MAG: TonB-dependent receptor plug domain-containing protein [Crocinitomicaceae bacterium]|nr:TonB-dependent receptor plug domain-containing protein [Crocinitomicaceae bacterium]